MLQDIFITRIVLFPLSFEAYTWKCIDLLAPFKANVKIFVCTYGKVERVVWHPGNAGVGSTEWDPSVGYEKLPLKHGLQQGSNASKIPFYYKNLKDILTLLSVGFIPVSFSADPARKIPFPPRVGEPRVATCWPPSCFRFLPATWLKLLLSASLLFCHRLKHFVF